MMVGRDEARELVYESFLSTETRKRKNDTDATFSGMLRSRLTDDSRYAAEHLGGSTTAIHNIDNKPTEFRLSEQTPRGLESSIQNCQENPCSPLRHKALTVLVCFDHVNSLDLPTLLVQLDNLRTIRNGLLFNIVPVSVCTEDDLEQEGLIDNIENQLKLSGFSNETRTTLYINSNNLKQIDFTNHIAQIYDVSSNISLYAHLNQALENLARVKGSDRDIKFLEDTLSSCRSMIGDTNLKTKTSIGMCLESNMGGIKNACRNLRNEIEQSDAPNKIYWGYVFFNFLKSLGMVLAACSVVGTYFAWQHASQNHRYHNNIFKFHPTNGKDEVRGRVAAVEDTCVNLSLGTP